MHFFLFFALIPSLCVLSVEIPPRSEVPIENHAQFFNNPYDNSQLPVNNEINPENTQLVDDKKSATSAASTYTHHQFRACSSLTILPLQDFVSCRTTINRLASAVCKNGNGNSGNSGNLRNLGRSRRSNENAYNEASVELEDALLEFTNNRNHNFWAQEEQQQLKRSAGIYGNQPQQQMYAHQTGFLHSGHADQVRKDLIRKCCKYSNVCQVESVVESLSESCNGNGGNGGSSNSPFVQSHHHQQQQPLHVAKARA